jgi:hypothetical protein
VGNGSLGDENIVRLQVAVNDGGVTRVQVQHTVSHIEAYRQLLRQGEFLLLVIEQHAKGAERTKLRYYPNRLHRYGAAVQLKNLGVTEARHNPRLADDLFNDVVPLE